MITVHPLNLSRSQRLRWPIEHLDPRVQVLRCRHARENGDDCILPG